MKRVHLEGRQGRSVEEVGSCRVNCRDTERLLDGSRNHEIDDHYLRWVRVC